MSRYPAISMAQASNGHQGPQEQPECPEAPQAGQQMGQTSQEPQQEAMANSLESQHYRHMAGSLYVGDLAYNVTEADLYAAFSPLGKVWCIKVPKNCWTNRSLGYAFVTYMNIDNAEQALDKLNYTKIKGQEIRIMWSQRNPAQRRSGQGNLIVRNLCKTISSRALYDTFYQFGNILSCKVPKDLNGKSKGYGLIHYETEEQAEKAIKLVNGMLIKEKIVTVERFQADRKQADGVANSFNNCFIKNIPKFTTDEQLGEIFKEYGKISSVKIMKDQNGNSRGFGFVCFVEPASAAKACQELNNKEVNGKKLYVACAQKKVERKKQLLKEFEGRNLYVCSLPERITSEDLHQEFGHCGSITSTKVITENGQCKGYAFVCFSQVQEAAWAIGMMNGRHIWGRRIFVNYAKGKAK